MVYMFVWSFYRFEIFDIYRYVLASWLGVSVLGSVFGNLERKIDSRFLGMETYDGFLVFIPRNALESSHL